MHLYNYVIVRVVVAYETNCMSNVGWKLALVQEMAKHYYCFLPILREQFIKNTMYIDIGNHFATN